MTGSSVPDQRTRTPLRSQSGTFWLGAFMTAEGVAAAVVGLLPADTRRHVLDVALSSTGGRMLLVTTPLLFGLAVGWLAHRLGWGD